MKNKIVENLLFDIGEDGYVECERSCDDCAAFGLDTYDCWKIRTIKGYIDGLENQLARIRSEVEESNL